MYKIGDAVLVRTMECTDKEYDRWDVMYKAAVVSSEPTYYNLNKKLYSVKFDTGIFDLVWDDQIVKKPE